jgi:hypothetical protein
MKLSAARSTLPIITFCIQRLVPLNAFAPSSLNSNLHTSFTLSMVQEQSDNVAKVKSRRLYSFEEARRIARGHGFDSKEEFLEYTCPGAYQIPKDADVVWKESWNGWDDFLGITLTFTEGREVARKLEGIESEEAYMALMKSKTIPDGDVASRLPYRPDLMYKEDWQGWKDFLVG